MLGIRSQPGYILKSLLYMAEMVCMHVVSLCMCVAIVYIYIYIYKELPNGCLLANIIL